MQCTEKRVCLTVHGGSTGFQHDIFVFKFSRTESLVSWYSNGVLEGEGLNLGE